MSQTNPTQLTPVFEQAIAAKVAENKAVDSAAREAAGEALPGPLKNIFAPAPDITVGQFTVRPFYDVDFELLSGIEHPLHRQMVKQMAGEEVSFEDYFPRGPKAWQLCYMLTVSPDEAEAAIQDGTIAAKAKARFSRLQFGALNALNTAIMNQMGIYWSALIGYGAPAKEGEKSPNPSTSSATPSTVSVGS